MSICCKLFLTNFKVLEVKKKLNVFVLKLYSSNKYLSEIKLTNKINKKKKTNITTVGRLNSRKS